jgi:hypothetical protein
MPSNDEPPGDDDDPGHDDDDLDGLFGETLDGATGDELIMFRPRRLFIPAGDGTYRVQLPSELRRLLGELMAGLRGRLMSGSTDPELQRLFPAAYNQNPELDDEYQRLMRDELLASRLGALDAFEQTIDAETVTTESLNQWLQSINALRLVLGTILDVSEDAPHVDPDDPRAADFELYDLLNVLLSSILDALRRGSKPTRTWPWQR